MFTAYIVVSILTATANTYAAIVDFRRPQWVVDNITKWGGSHSWLFPLGALKGAGALGLLVGIGVPLIGIAAAVGLVLFFVGAITVVTRAHWYSHLRWPVTYLFAGRSIAGAEADSVVSERWIGSSWRRCQLQPPKAQEF